MGRRAGPSVPQTTRGGGGEGGGGRGLRKVGKKKGRGMEEEGERLRGEGIE